MPSEVSTIIEELKHENIKIKNSRVENLNNMYLEDKDLKLNELIISDELYSISINLDKLFPILVLKMGHFIYFKTEMKIMKN